jgi:hypothetical protein
LHPALDGAPVREAGKAQSLTQASIFGEQATQFTFFEGA